MTKPEPITLETVLGRVTHVNKQTIDNLIAVLRENQEVRARRPHVYLNFSMDDYFVPIYHDDDEEDIHYCGTQACMAGFAYLFLNPDGTLLEQPHVSQDGYFKVDLSITYDEGSQRANNTARYFLEHSLYSNHEDYQRDIRAIKSLLFVAWNNKYTKSTDYAILRLERLRDTGDICI